MLKEIVLLTVLNLPAVAATPAGFIDHGVAAPVAESRGVAAVRDAAGHNLALACSNDLSPRGWILVTDIDRGESQQYWYPENVPNSPPFASLFSKNGRFYTCAGKTLLEFDLDARRWLFHGVPAPSEQCYVGTAFADGPDGRIYAGSYPNCHVVAYDPQTRKMTDYGPVDPQEHYIYSLVVEPSGWVYCGIGTARCNLTALLPRTGERRQLLPEAERKLGVGRVYLGTDGKAYGCASDQWYRLSEGKAEPIAKEAAAPPAPSGAMEWSKCRGVFPDGRRLVNYNLPERWLEIADADGKQIKRLRLDYQSEGAEITSLTAGPNGKVYGSTCHPMHFVAYTPNAAKIEDWGPLERVGGGNFCAMAVQGPYVVGAAYWGGYFYCYDTRKPWNNEQGADPNPRLLARYNGDITRPRTALAYPDGRHVLMAGFMDYGRRGGGMGIFDLETGQSTLITHEDLIPNQSTITLKVLPNGDLVGGASVETPGGGHVTEKEGALYLMEWQTRKVTFRTVPVPGAREVFSLEVGPDGLVYGLASGSEFFVFDPKQRQVVHREKLAQYGGLPRPALLRSPDGKIYAILTNAILRIEPGTFRAVKLATPPAPITAGAAILNGRLYFAGGAHLWSYGLESKD